MACGSENSPASSASAPGPSGKPSEQAPVSPGGFAAAFYADFAPAQAAAIRRAVDLMSQARRS